MGTKNYNFKSFYPALSTIIVLSLGFAISRIRLESSIFINLSYLGVFLVTFFGSATIFFPLPNVPTVFAAGLFLNPIGVAIAGGLGSSFGEITGYLVGRSGKEILLQNDKYLRIRQWLNRYKWITIFLLALIPNPLFDVAGILAGNTRYPIIKFYSATFLGKTLRSFILAYLGSLIV